MSAKPPPTSPPTWALQNVEGRQEAATLIEKIQNQELPMVLGHRVKSMIERGEYGGREVGFFHEIAETLIYSR